MFRRPASKGGFSHARSYSWRYARELHLGLLRTDGDYREAVRYLEDWPPANPERSRRIGDTGDLEQVLLCVYQVRNNLFHGGKMPDSSRDGRIVRESFTIVSKILRPLSCTGNMGLIEA